MTPSQGCAWQDFHRFPMTVLVTFQFPCFSNDLKFPWFGYKIPIGSLARYTWFLQWSSLAFPTGCLIHRHSPRNEVDWLDFECHVVFVAYPMCQPMCWITVSLKLTNIHGLGFTYRILLGGDWNHGMDYDFPFSWEWNIIPTDFHSIIFQRGWLKPPTRICGCLPNFGSPQKSCAFSRLPTTMMKRPCHASPAVCWRKTSVQDGTLLS